MATQKAQSFKENYQVLKEIAEKFRKQASSENVMPDIDSLVDDIERASQAYKNCKRRLDTVSSKLEEVLSEDEQNKE